MYVKTILERARDKAVALIDHLGRRGYVDFGKLLS